MNIILTLILIGISLSMDAFSLALIYGTYSLEMKKRYLLSVVVGVFHFFMPLMGLVFGSFLSNYFLLDVNLVVGIIFCIIGIEMIFSSIKDDETILMVSFCGFLLFGLSVSIDSFTTGIGLSLISDNYILCSFVFMVISSFFTFLGLNCGNKLNQYFGKYSTFLGGVIMILLSFNYLFFR